MIYSGVDLIRQAESTQARAEKFNGPKAVTPPTGAEANDKDPDSQGALLRFARFIHKEKRKKPVSKSATHPYSQTWRRLHQAEDIGQGIDIYV